MKLAEPRNKDEYEKQHADDDENVSLATLDESPRGFLIDVVLVVADRDKYTAGCHATKYPSAAASDLGQSPRGGRVGRAGRTKSPHQAILFQDN
jgi:hypothetical protein